MRILLSTFILLILSFSTFGQELGFAIKPMLWTVKKNVVNEARIISDLNERFECAWIKKYHSVVFTATNNGVSEVAKGNSFELNDAQLEMLKNAETGTDIHVLVQYIPDNFLTEEIKEMTFSIKVAPDVDAVFGTEEKSVKQFLQTHAIDHLTSKEIEDLFEIKIRFQVDENGLARNLILHKRSHLERVNSVLLDAIKNMPTWIPATNQDGTLVSQYFELIVTKDLCGNNLTSE